VFSWGVLEWPNFPNLPALCRVVWIAWRVPIFMSVECRGIVVSLPRSLSFVCRFPSEIAISQPRQLASRRKRRRSSLGFIVKDPGQRSGSKIRVKGPGNRRGGLA
jgi:hypothetical protein